MAEIMDKKDDIAKFSRQYNDILKGLEHHWSPQLECFCDITVSEGGMWSLFDFPAHVIT